MASSGTEVESQHYPLEKSYGVNLAVAIFALVPFLVITTAYDLLEKQIGAELGISKNALSIFSTLSTAGYAFGALLGGDLIQRFQQRKLFFICESLFIVGCVVSASALGMVQFGTGMVLQGFATGLLLVTALPPVVRYFPAAKMVTTSGAVNLGFFGATTVGPLIGGAIALGHDWRWLYAGFGAVGLAVLVLSWFSLTMRPPSNPGERFDFAAVSLALAATVLPFLASGELTGHGFNSYWFMVPLAVGFACFVAMLLTEYQQKNPLSPVKKMWKTTPLVGTIAAMIGGGAFVTFLLLAERYEAMVRHTPTLSAGLSFWPQVVGVILASGALMLLVRSRYLPLLVLFGMLALIGGGLLLLAAVPTGSNRLLLAAAGLLGLGAGATVSPGLWMAAFALPSKMVGRTFALVELVRSEADFMLAPVLVAVAQVVSGRKLTASGIHYALWMMVIITFATTALMIGLYVGGGERLPKPDLEEWIGGENPGMETTAVLGALRKSGQ